MSIKLVQDFYIGKNIRRLRLEKKWTQKELAAQLESRNLKANREYVAQIESGNRNVPISILIALKHIFGVEHYDEFFKEIYVPDKKKN